MIFARESESNEWKRSGKNNWCKCAHTSILSPSRNLENGHREYSDDDMDRLQQILFFKECGFSLAQIKEHLNSPSFDREKAFDLQKKFLLHEKRRIELSLKLLRNQYRI